MLMVSILLGNTKNDKVGLAIFFGGVQPTVVNGAATHTKSQLVHMKGKITDYSFMCA